jgi:hypothetical protein
LFKRLGNTTIPNLIERSQFNKRRRKLFDFSETIRTTLASSFLEFEDYFVIDNMPLEICEKSRESRLEICKKIQIAPSKGGVHRNTAQIGKKHLGDRNQYCLECIVSINFTECFTT